MDRRVSISLGKRDSRQAGEQAGQGPLSVCGFFLIDTPLFSADTRLTNGVGADADELQF